MNITVIYSTGRKVQSCTYNIARLLIRELLADDELFEFQLPRDMPHICVGCYACIKGQEQKCGGASALAPILAAMERSELIIFCTPTYVFHAPGQMKILLDHFAYRWLIHRPDLSFIKKQAVVINTAGGGGMRSTVREIKTAPTTGGSPERIFFRRRCGIMTGQICLHRSVDQQKGRWCGLHGMSGAELNI